MLCGTRLIRYSDCYALSKMVNANLFIFFAAIITCQGFRVTEVNGVETLMAHENEEVTIECAADFDSANCSLVHPSGKQISVPGASLDVCSYKTNMTAADNGRWQCYIGRMGSPEIETIKIIDVQVTSQLAATQGTLQIIDVQVTSQLAATQKTVSAAHGKGAALSCLTVDRAPLTYCHFEPPAGERFSMDSNVTLEKAILERYYFPPNKSLDRGDCAVSIRRVRHDDVGRWTCVAGLGDGKEHLDTIQLQAKGVNIKKKETFIAFGAAGIVAFLGILGFVLKRRCVRDVRTEVPRPVLPPHIRIPTIVVQSPSPTRSWA